MFSRRVKLTAVIGAPSWCGLTDNFNFILRFLSQVHLTGFSGRHTCFFFFLFTASRHRSVIVTAYLQPINLFLTFTKLVTFEPKIDFQRQLPPKRHVSLAHSLYKYETEYKIQEIVSKNQLFYLKMNHILEVTRCLPHRDHDNVFF